jgi:hypothetical protein
LDVVRKLPAGKEIYNFVHATYFFIFLFRKKWVTLRGNLKLVIYGRISAEYFAG